MLPGLEAMGCHNLAVPAEVMTRVVNIESSGNPYAIGVVGGRLTRQPQNLPEAVATAQMLEEKGHNYSLGIAQINRANLGKHGLDTLEKAFEYCPNLKAGSRILAQCYASAGNDWGKALSCYYSGNFTTGYEHGYVQRVLDSMKQEPSTASTKAIPLATASSPRTKKAAANIVSNSSTALVAMRRAADSAFVPQVRAPGDLATQPASPPADTPAQHSESEDHAFVF